MSLNRTESKPSVFKGYLEIEYLQNVYLREFKAHVARVCIVHEPIEWEMRVVQSLV